MLAVVHERAGRLLPKRARSPSEPVGSLQNDYLEPGVNELARACQPGDAAPDYRDSRRYGLPPFKRDISIVLAAMESFLVVDREMRLAKTS